MFKALADVRKPIKNQRGVALMIAVACLMLIMYFAVEVSYDSNVEYIVNSQGLNRMKAYYAAKSGMQLSLLRIKIFQQARNKLGAQLGNSPLLDKIWQFPFAWPMPIPDELSAIDKDNFKKIFKESALDSAYAATIEDEGSKIDLNDLNSPSKYLRDYTHKQLVNIFEQQKKNSETFEKEHSSVRFDELVNNIADWMSDKATSLNGGDKRSNYSDINSESQSDYYPPNRAFRTIEELRLVPGMTDEFYMLLEPRITIYGMKGINPNLATKEVLQSLDPAITEEIANKIIKRRTTEAEGGPFKCDADGGSSDFWGYVTSQDARVSIETETIPITCDTVTNFKIRSSGEFAGASREITAIVMDMNRTATKIKNFIDKEKKAEPGQEQQSSGQQQKQTPPPDPLPKGAPRIVFWSER